jgi:YD repeat-containing protein
MVLTAGDLGSQLSPDTGASASTFDPAGNLLTFTDARGVVASYSYDALNRVTAVTITPPPGSGINSAAHIYSYDQGLNGIGRLTGITDPTGSTFYAYDALGRVTNETRILGGHSYATAYNYDSAGRLTALTLPSGRTISYGLDALGRVSSISTSLNGQAKTVVSNVTYRPFGMPQTFTFGNGQTYARTYDLDDRITGHSLGASSVTLSYDADSRIIGLVDGAVSFGYSYDELDRLVGFVAPQSAKLQRRGGQPPDQSMAPTATLTISRHHNRL